MVGHVVQYHFVGADATDLVGNGGKVLGRHIKGVGIILKTAVAAFAFCQELHELLENHVFTANGVVFLLGSHLPVKDDAKLVDNALQKGAYDLVVIITALGFKFSFYYLIIT